MAYSSFLANIGEGTITYEQLQDVSVDNALLGRYSVGAGPVQEILIGTGFDLTGNTLNTTAVDLGLVIGVNVQAWDADLDSLSAAIGEDVIYYRGPSSTWSPVTYGVDSSLAFSGGVLDQHVADSTHNGYLSKEDWTSFQEAVIEAGVSSFNSRVGAVLPAANDYSEAMLSFTDITTNDVSITKHGFQSKLPNDPTLFMNGEGDYVAIPAVGGGAGSQVISGGGVAWDGVGFDYTISAAIYSINGVQYSSPETHVTLSGADGSFDRIDLFVVDTSGVASVVEGSAAANPVAPSIDPVTQLILTFAVVPTGASTPSVTTENIYLENTEYTTSTNSAGTITLASTNFPFAGTKDIEATAATNGNYVTLVKGSGNLNLSNFTSLVFQIRSKGAWPNPKSLSVFWLNGASTIGVAAAIKNGTFGFSSSITASYQQIVIPASAFGTGTSAVDRLRIAVAGGSSSIGWYIDNIILQAPDSGGGGGGGSGSGDVSSNTTTSIASDFAQFADVSGKLLKDGGLSLTTSTSLGSSNVLIPSQNAVKAYVDAAVAGVGTISDAAFNISWNAVTTSAPSKNAVYDIIHAFDTDDDGKINVLDMGAGLVKTDSGGVVSAATAGTDYADNAFKTIAVSGQSNIVADSASDTLTLVNGTNITITQDASTDTITINAASAASQIDDTAFGSSWNSVTSFAPTKNAVYDIIHAFDTDDDGKVNVLDAGAGLIKTDSSGVVGLASAGTDYADNAFKTLSVSGQSDVVADSAADTLTLVGAGGLTITTNASTDTVTFTSPAAVTIIRTIGATWDGVGDVLVTGNAKGYITVPYAGTITGWSISLDVGTATIKVLRIAAGTVIPSASINTSGVAISTGTSIRSSTVSDFGANTAVAVGDIFAFNLFAVAGGATQLTFELEITQS